MSAVPGTAGSVLTADIRPEAERGVAIGVRKRPVALTIVLIALTALYAPTLRWLFERWTLSVWHHAHGLFVPPIVGWLIWRELRAHPEFRRDEGSARGFALLVPALLIHALDTGMHTQLLSAMSILIALPGLSLLFLGARRTKVILFPLLFSAFALPIPLALTEAAHYGLRLVTANGTAEVLPYLGIPAFLEGTTLQVKTTALEIADACSGFSTLYAALAAACLAAHSTSSIARRVLVLAAAAPVAIASNVLRIVLLATLVVWRGPDVLHTPLHPLSGMMTFAISLPLIFWLAGPAERRLRRH